MASGWRSRRPRSTWAGWIATPRRRSERGRCTPLLGWHVCALLAPFLGLGLAAALAGRDWAELRRLALFGLAVLAQNLAREHFALGRYFLYPAEEYRRLRGPPWRVAEHEAPARPGGCFAEAAVSDHELRPDATDDVFKVDAGSHGVDVRGVEAS